VRLFAGVLDAIGYAHARGILHRDLKPANIMIGPHGEVTVLDWGIAKPIPKRSRVEGVDALTRTIAGAPDARLLATQLGALAGTPLYMSPEQAAGLNDDLDERSDVYSLCVLLYEWLVLEHPLRDKTSVFELLATIVLADYSMAQIFDAGQAAAVPMEYLWILRRGLRRDRGERYQSVDELAAALRAVEDGDIRIQCNVTWAKNRTQRVLRWIDRHSRLFTLLCRGARVAAVVGTAAAVAAAALHVL
jgi:serine/threonine-protein kinase